MKPKQKSIIPEKAQIPVMVTGAIILALLLVWRFSPPDTAAAPAADVAQAPTAPAALAAPTPGAAPAIPGLPPADGTVAGLAALVAEAQKAMNIPPPEVPGIPPLASNPFSPMSPVEARLDAVPEGMTPEEWAQEEDQGDPGEALAGLDELLPTEAELDRQFRVESLELTGTITTGRWAMAVINDGYYRKGESVEGFTVAQISEKEVVLRDAQGEIKLKFEYNDATAHPAAPAPKRSAGSFTPSSEEAEAPEAEGMAMAIGVGGS